NCGSEMIEEHERTDRPAHRVRERAPDAEAAEIDAAWDDDMLDGVATGGVTGERVFARKKAHVDTPDSAGDRGFRTLGRYPDGYPRSNGCRCLRSERSALKSIHLARRF